MREASDAARSLAYPSVMPAGRVLAAVALARQVDGAASACESTRVDDRGAGGDRTHAVLHEHKGEWKPLTAREAPRLLAWRAAYPFARRRRAAAGAPAVRARDRAGRRAHLQLGRPAAAHRAGGRPRPPGAAAPRRRRDPGPRAQPAAHRRGDPRRARRGARDRARPAPLPPQPAPRARRARLGRARLGGPDAALRGRRRRCGCCTRACAARSPRATPTRRRSGRSCCATSPPATRRCSGSTRGCSGPAASRPGETVEIAPVTNPHYRTRCVAPIRPHLPRLEETELCCVSTRRPRPWWPRRPAGSSRRATPTVPSCSRCSPPPGTRSPRSWVIRAFASWPPSPSRASTSSPSTSRPVAPSSSR